MRVQKTVFDGNQFIGLFARANDKFVFIPPGSPPKFYEACVQSLQAEPVQVVINNSHLVGIFTSINSNGAVLHSLASKEDEQAFKKVGLNTCLLKGKFTAVGNNILANDKAAVVNPRLGPQEIRSISDCLGVEVLKREIAGFKTVGSVAVVTNSGLLLHNDVTEDEMKELEGLFKVNAAKGTANMGIPFIGLCIVANTKGYVIGEPTSGFELGRIDDALGFVQR